MDILGYEESELHPNTAQLPLYRYLIKGGEITPWMAQ